jgi:hypothetical protein
MGNRGVVKAAKQDYDNGRISLDEYQRISLDNLPPWSKESRKIRKSLERRRKSVDQPSPGEKEQGPEEGEKTNSTKESQHTYGDMARAHA